LKLKEIKLKSSGYRQQNVNYINQRATIVVPRSQKAFMIHSLSILIKLVSVGGCMVFMNLSSLVWRFIFGLVLGGLICRILLILSHTKSNVTYLISFGLLIRVSVGLFVISLVSVFYIQPFDVYTTEIIYFVLTAIVIFDSFLMQIIGLILGKHASRPIIRQYDEIDLRFREGYQVYNDVPVISIIYPLFRWFFG